MTDKRYILVLNGPNLNLLGKREPEIYGSRTLDDILGSLRERFADRVRLVDFQSNSEGRLITWIQDYGFSADCLGIVLNAGAYTHTSLAIADAVAAVPAPVVEVHLSNVFAREEVRHHSFLAPVCLGSISGFGEDSYFLAVEALLRKHSR